MSDIKRLNRKTLRTFLGLTSLVVSWTLAMNYAFGFVALTHDSAQWSETTRAGYVMIMIFIFMLYTAGLFALAQGYDKQRDKLY